MDESEIMRIVGHLESSQNAAEEFRNYTRNKLDEIHKQLQLLSTVSQRVKTIETEIEDEIRPELEANKAFRNKGKGILAGFTLAGGAAALSLDKIWSSIRDFWVS